MSSECPLTAWANQVANQLSQK